jgi:hypothetical protein
MDDAMTKGMVPSRFMRGYLAAGHQADSPGTTGHYGVSAAPSMGMQPGGEPHVVMPERFTRGWIVPGHEAEPPDDQPEGNNPHPAGTSGAQVYATAADRYTANRAAERIDHVMPSQAITATTAPVRQAALPSDMRAASVPHATVVAASRPAPGETR